MAMVGIHSPQNSKKQKVFEEINDEDRISNLPLCILHYILSFLPTKCAVATSVLASSWRYLWRSTHNLDFMEGYGYDHKIMPFCTIVNKVLLLHDCSNINRFSLNCYWELDPAYFDAWISTLLERNVQELILNNVRVKKSNGFPHCFFTCGSLRTLKIDEFTMGSSIDIPASILFPNLKVFHVRQVAFSCEKSPQEVTFNCPMLNELDIDNCKWLEIKIVNIYAPALQFLIIKDWSKHIAPFDCEMKFFAESLLSLRLESAFPYCYSLCHQSSLRKAFIDVFNVEESVHRLHMILKQISSVQNLELSKRSIKALSKPDVSPYMLTFSELIHLSCFTGTYKKTSGRQFIDMICKVPTIRSLSFPNGCRLLVFKGHGRILGTTPNNFLQQLKFVDFQEFSGYENELWFVKFLLKSANVLEKITLKLTDHDWKYHKMVTKERITEKLQSLAKVSKCIIEIS